MLKQYIRHVVVVFFILCVPPVWAGHQFYADRLEQATWRNSGNKLECRLSQLIPGYGTAMFTRRATRPMEFQVSSLQTPRKPGHALIYVKPPIWKQYANQKILGEVPVSMSHKVLALPEDWAYRIAYELREGMEAVWTYADWIEGQDLVTVKVLPILFENAWRDFQRCEQHLIKYTYRDVRYFEFYFTVNSTRLAAKEKARLSRLAEYVLLDPDYRHILIKAFSDSRGVRRINLAVSNKRARAVKNFLVAKGVNPKRFVIRAQGEKKPKYNNRSRKGRAKNRRVEVSLVK